MIWSEPPSPRAPRTECEPERKRAPHAKSAMIILGFTGSRKGMTVAQRSAFNGLLISAGMKTFLNGAAIGADREALEVIKQYPKVVVELYPGDRRQELYAVDYAIDRGSGVILHAPLPYLHRNRIIANRCDYLIATPEQAVETRRSGTWATIRYAQDAGKKISIIEPDGVVRQLAAQ